jgi:hypothetical protein
VERLPVAHAVMPPTLKGDLWPLFHREATLKYMGGTIYARCKACTSEISLTDDTALRGQLKGDEESVAAGRLGASSSASSSVATAKCTRTSRSAASSRPRPRPR